MSEITAASVEARHRVRAYYAHTIEIERRVLRAVTSGDCTGLEPDALTIAHAVLALPESRRGLNVASILIDRDDIRTQWIVTGVLRDGGHRSVLVSYPNPQ